MPAWMTYIQNISDTLMETGFVLSSTSLYNIIVSNCMDFTFADEYSLDKNTLS